MPYTLGALAAILIAVVVDLRVTRCALVRTRTFWLAYAIILVFQLIMNGLLTGIPIVSYDPSVHLGPRLANAPIEDIGFGFGLVLITLTTWVRLGEQAGRRTPR